jgi:hypothetical protein
MRSDDLDGVVLGPGHIQENISLFGTGESEESVVASFPGGRLRGFESCPSQRLISGVQGLPSGERRRVCDHPREIAARRGSD